jgi:hypothetical protein
MRETCLDENLPNISQALPMRIASHPVSFFTSCFIVLLSVDGSVTKTVSANNSAAVAPFIYTCRRQSCKIFGREIFD